MKLHSVFGCGAGPKGWARIMNIAGRGSKARNLRRMAGMPRLREFHGYRFGNPHPRELPIIFTGS
jgi:hypothetical protein